jgi:hypothetical protein
VAVQAEQFRLVVVAKERDCRRIHEGEVAVVVDDVEAVRRLLGDPQRNAERDGRRARGASGARQGPIIAPAEPPV